jgi:hypothetical protein
MDRSTPPFLRWLALAALGDWLITRSLARSAIFMPKTPPVIAGYRIVTQVGQVTSMLAALLALVGMVWLAIQLRRLFYGVLSLGLSSLAIMSLVFILVPPGGTGVLAFQVVELCVLAGLLWGVWRSHAPREIKISITLPVGALCLSSFYQMSQAIYSALHWPGPPPLGTTLFNVGELFAVLTPLGLWWALRRVEQAANLPYLPYLWAAIPALAFGIFYFLNPEMAGILAIWSTGLTLYLPWPLYAFSLWIAGVTLFAARRQGSPVGLALILLIASGYAPQLSSQVFFGLIGLSWMIIGENEVSVSSRAAGTPFSPSIPEIGAGVVEQG